jgi:hypothetical protein
VSVRVTRIAVGLLAMLAAMALFAVDADAAISLASGVAYPCANCTRVVQTADLAHDGKLGLVLPAQASGVALLRGNGDGTFTMPQYLPTSHSTYATAVGDVNADGAPDIVAAMGDAAEVQVLLNHADGSGTFALPVVTALPVGCDAPRAITSGDFNGDGKDDIAVAAECDLTGNGTGYCCGSIAILLSSGGALTPATGGSPCKPSGSTDSCYDEGGIYGSATWLGASRLRGGALTDVIAIDGACGFDSGSVKVFAGYGDGRFEAGKGPSGSNVACPSNEAALADLNGDGRRDVLVTGASPAHNCYNDGDCANLEFLAGDGDTNLAEGVTTVTDHRRDKPPAAVDLDADGFPDIVAPECCASGDMLETYAGNGSGTFASAVPFTGASPGGGPRYVAAGDFNRDGRPDVVAAYDNAVEVYLNASDYRGTTTCTVDPSNLVCDGNFEDPVIGGPYATFGAGGHFGPWQVDAGSVDLERDVEPAAGRQSLDLNGTGAGGVSQLVPTSADADYVLEFAYTANPSCGDTSAHFSVSYDGKVVDELGASSAGHTNVSPAWQSSKQYPLPLTTSSAARLSFASTGPPGPCGLMIDNVRLYASAAAPAATPTPVPTTPHPFSDCHGTGGPNAAILGIEVTQGVQTATFPARGEGCARAPRFLTVHPGASYPSGPLFTNELVNYVGLAAGKFTLARVYANLQQGSRKSLPMLAFLYGYRNGKPIDSNSAFDANPEVAFSKLLPGSERVTYSARLSENGSFDFVLPDSWTEGHVDLIAVLLTQSGPDKIKQCAGCTVDDIYTLRGVHFTKTRTMQIQTVGLNTPTVKLGRAEDALGALGWLLPIGDRDLTLQTLGFNGTLDIPQDHACDIAWIADNLLKPWGAKQDFRASVNRVLGVYAGDYFDDHLAPGGKFCQAGQTVNGAVATDGPFESEKIPPDGQPYSIASAKRPLSSVVHEVLHGLWLPHAGQNCPPDSPTDSQRGAPWPPDNRGYLQGIGTNFRSRTHGHYTVVGPFDPAAGFYTQQFDLMSYCPLRLFDATGPLAPALAVLEGREWMSPRTWDTVLTRMAAPGSGIRLSQAAARPAPADGANPATAAAASGPANVEIHTPLARERFAAGESVRLAGAGFATDGARVSDRALTWFANGRRVARGSGISVSDLPPGRVVLELRGSRAVRAHVIVHVTSSAPAFVVLDAPPRVSARARRVVLRLSATVPAALRVSGRGVARTRASLTRAVRRVVIRVRPGRGALKLMLALRAGARRTAEAATILR